MRRAAVGAAVVMVMAAAAGAGAADETYSGTVAIASGEAKPVSVPIMLTIKSSTSDERANQLAQLLHDRGHAAAVAELIKDDVGQIGLGDADRFRIALIRKEPTPNGQVLRIVTDRPMYLAGKPPAAAPPEHAVGYLELTLDGAGSGTGRLIPAVRAGFDKDGYVAPENVGAAPWAVAGVRRTP